MSSYSSPFRLPVGLDAVSWHWFFSAISLWEGDGDCTVRRSYGKRTPAPNQWGKKRNKRLKKIENGEGKDYRQRYDPFLDRFPNRFGGLVKLHPIHRGRQPSPCCKRPLNGLTHSTPLVLCIRCTLGSFEFIHRAYGQRKQTEMLP